MSGPASPSRSQRPPRYDLFLSYNRADVFLLRQVQQGLASRGLATFLDEDNLQKGDGWGPSLEDALRSTRAVAVFFGPNGLGPWQKKEMWVALDLQSRAEFFPVVLVLLPGADYQRAPLFLRQNTWVDLRDGIAGPGALDALIRLADPSLASMAETPPAVLECPYRALRPFREEDAHFFFGREKFSEVLLQKTLQHRLVAVVGASGSGKSSVIQAGLLPLLRQQRALVWDAISFTPGEHPLASLAAALMSLLMPSKPIEERLGSIQELARELKEGRVPLEQLLADALRGSPRTEKLLVIVDQFEELFTFAAMDERQPFLDTLLGLCSLGPVTVALTLRSDYYAQAINADRRLSDLLQAGVVNLGPIDAEELSRIIVEPARRLGISFEPTLVDRLLADMGREPGKLPLLEFTLTRLWKERDGRQIRAQSYRPGMLESVLGQHAEEAFQTLSQKGRDVPALALRGLTRLVRVTSANEEGTDARQRVQLSRLAPETVAALRPLVDAHLLTTDLSHSSNEEVIEVAHEALLRSWKRLADRLNEAREFLLWRQRFALLVDAWEGASEEEKKKALLHGLSLETAVRWLKDWEEELNPLERELIRRSQRELRKSSRLRRLAVVAAGGLALSSAAGITGWTAWTRSATYQVEQLPERAPVDDVTAEHPTIAIQWVEALIHGGHHDEALSVARGISNIEWRSKALAMASKRLVEHGRFEQANDAISESITKAPRVESVHLLALTHVSKTLVQEGQTESVKTLVSAIHADPGSEISSRIGIDIALIEGLLDANALPLAQKQFELTVARILTEPKDDIWYQHLNVEGIDKIVEQAKRLHREKTLAEVFLKRAIDLGSGRGRVRWGVRLVLATRLAQLNDVAGALHVLADTVSVELGEWEHANSQAMGNEIATLVKALAHAGKSAEVVSMALNAKGAMATKIEASLAVALIEADQKTAALDLLKRIPSGHLMDVNFHRVMRTLLEKGHHKDAQELRRRINQPPPSPDVDYLISALLLGEGIPDGYHFGNQDGANGVIYSELLNAKNIEVIMKLHHVEELEPGFKQTVNATVVEVLLTQGRREEALELGKESLEGLKSLRDKKVLRSIDYRLKLENLARKFEKAGELDAARDALEQMFGTSEREEFVSSFTQVLLRANKPEEAARILRSEKLENEAEYSRLLADLVVSFADANQGELAHAELGPEGLDRIQYSEDKSRAQAALAKWRARKGEFREALELVGNCNSQDRLDAYATILVEYESAKTPGGKKLPLETLVTWPEEK